MSPSAVLLALVSVGLGFVGLRLLRKPGGGAPERALGAAFLAFGLGALPRFLVVQVAGPDGRLSTGMAAANVVSHLLFQVGVGGFAVFTWRVFHPGAAWARNLAVLLFLASLAPTAMLLIEPATAREAGFAAMAVNATRSLTTLWTFAECLRYALLMRRRVQLRLADPIVANRFVLWSAWTGAFGFAPLAFLALRLNSQRYLALGLDPRVEAAWTLPAAAGIGTVSLVVAILGVWLAFFPPAAYRRWVRGHA